jgi:sulfofructose kinase
MIEPYDVLGLGYASIDDLLFLPRFPEPDAKMQVERHERHCGGLTATALVAAARLGSRCAFAGVLGKDELSEHVLGCLAAEGIDTRYVYRDRQARPVHSVILVDQSAATRTILFNLSGVRGARSDWPEAEVIRAAGVLFVDDCGPAGMARAAGIARASKIPVVADIEGDESPAFEALWGLVDHLILSQGFASRVTGQADPARAAAALFNGDRRMTAVTCGAGGVWYVDAGDPSRARHCAAFPVRAVDTTGCGDVFHGAYASALARGLDVEGRMEFAAAAAAMKACFPGGQAGIPGRAQVEAFLGQRRGAEGGGLP